MNPPLAFADRPSSDGRLLIVVFRDGVPAAGIPVAGRFGHFTTRADGSFTLNLPAGTHKTKVADLEPFIEFHIVSDQETQVTVQMFGDGQSRIALSEPDDSLTADEAQRESVVAKTVTVVSEKTGLPIAGASLIVGGSQDTFKTNASGQVAVPLTPGTNISIFHDNFQTLSVSEKSLSTDLKLQLKEAINELEDVVVLAPKIKGSVSALVEVRRKSAAVTDVLGTEQMARAGDSDAASSLRRVTGLTLIKGKYVYVRGLGERYSSVLMNDFSLPSPEPARRVVPMDLFPTAMLESIVVQKSFSPDRPAEFGGGVIQMQTRSLPEKFFFKASVGATIEDNENRLAYSGGSMDWLGYDDGTRKLPSSIRNVLASGQKLVPKQTGSSDGLSPEELTQLGRALPNQYNTYRSNKNPPPSLTLATGNRFRLGVANAGAAVSLLYGQSIEAGEKLSRGYNVGSGGALVPDISDNIEFSETETRLAGGLDTGLELGKYHKLSLSTLLLRHSTDFTQQRVRQSSATPTSSQESTTLEWTERQLWTSHLKGGHNFAPAVGWPVELNWRAGLAKASRLSPDRRDYTFERTPDSYQIRGDSGGNKRTYSELTDDSKEFGVDVTVPLTSNPDFIKIKLGASTVLRERRSDVFRLFFQRDFSGASPVDLGAPLETQFASENIGPGRYMLQNLTDAADSYSGRQTVDSQYVAFDVSPVKAWHLQTGLRQERSVQSVKTFRYFDPGTPFATSELTMTDLLPSHSVTWKPNDKWRARLAYSETLARPDFRELSTVGFIDDETGYEVFGNPNLKGTFIKNLDHRWEYYFSSDEYTSVGGFYKNFSNPIEVMFVPGVNKIQSFDNAKAAQNYGLEFETRAGLRHMGRYFRRWSVLGNYTWIESKIILDERNRGIQTSDKRPLQGQAPYSANLQLQYDRPLWGLTSALVYNVIGPRITEVGTNQIPDTYEEPFHQLDLVLSKAIAKNMTIGLRAKNLLDPKVEASQGDKIVRQYRRGRTAGVNLNAVF